MKTSSIVLYAVAALAGLSEAKRGCRHDKANPGMGWYYIVSGDTLNDIAADFSTTATHLAEINGIANPDSIPADKTIVVPCA
ncbi:hypothetical protein GCG54_00015125 [Colletotrichum gloeosporioides]|uniref:LysM domain-containing protein n=1 Tax=Colletotrichum gloeosporioides TaxID=474922 RepID=A0A8H4FGV9_COLGL|nr:uncharacterized protein GCG54_00015125 [Colletotrichum gloeosporioides]KAF3801903.1 hypothetical protein GCG54_00015125 [Colletotrichum gloeosporioides]